MEDIIKKMGKGVSCVNVKINPEIKLSFLSKMEESGIYKLNSFMRWLLDKWMISELCDSDPLSPSVRSFIVLMSEQVIKRGSNACGSFCVSGVSGWANQVREVSRKSCFKTAYKTLRCMIYTVVMCDHNLLRKLLHEYCFGDIVRIKFRSHDFRTKIKTDIYNRIESLYNESPTTIIRRLIDVLLSKNSQMKELIMNNISNNPVLYTDANNGKWVSVGIFDDLYRLRLFEFMAKHNIKSRSMLIHILINISLILPDITHSGVSAEMTEPYEVNDVDEYQQYINDCMDANYYKNTWL